jgi:Helicase associated domain
LAESFASREEWALMYRQGLRPEQIAELCSVPVHQVRRSIGQRKRIDPLLETAHLNNAPEPPPPSPVTPSWLARLGEFKAFLAEEGRLPRQQAGDAREKSLGSWLRLQRTAHAKGKLDDQQVEALNEAGEWQVSARAQADEARWQTRLEQLSGFVEATGRCPHSVIATTRWNARPVPGFTSSGRKLPGESSPRGTGSSSMRQCPAGTPGVRR